MEPSLIKSVPGAYTVYQTEDAEVLIVLDGLSVSDRIEPYPAQTFIHENYVVFLSAYVICLVVSLSYLAGRHVLVPLWRTQKHATNHVH